jgi:hypothetical protein
VDLEVFSTRSSNGEENGCCKGHRDPLTVRRTTGVVRIDTPTFEEETTPDTAVGWSGALLLSLSHAAENNAALANTIAVTKGML